MAQKSRQQLEVKIFEKLQFPRIKKRKKGVSVVCKKGKKIVAIFPTVGMAAAYIAPRANFSEKYTRISIYRALKTGEMFPPFSNYFWEKEQASKGSLISFEPNDLKNSPFLAKEKAAHKVAEPRKGEK